MWLLSLRFSCWRKIFFKLLWYVAYVNRRYISEEKTVADNKWRSFPHKSQSWYITHKWFTWMLYRKRISMGRLGHITYWESIISYAGELSSKYVNEVTHVFTIEIQTFLFNTELSTCLLYTSPFNVIQTTHKHRPKYLLIGEINRHTIYLYSKVDRLTLESESYKELSGAELYIKN